MKKRLTFKEIQTPQEREEEKQKKTKQNTMEMKGHSMRKQQLRKNPFQGRRQRPRK